MPRTVSIVEVETFLWILLTEPQRLALRNLDSGEPGVSRCVVGKLKDDVYFFEGAESGFRVKEVY
jgi:hypothetical protein